MIIKKLFLLLAIIMLIDGKHSKQFFECLPCSDYIIAHFISTVNIRVLIFTKISYFTPKRHLPPESIGLVGIFLRFDLINGRIMVWWCGTKNI